MCALERLDDDRGAADSVDGGADVAAFTNEGGRGDIDFVAGQDLHRAKFVPAVGDAVGGVRGVDVHCLELAAHGQPVERDRCSDARQDGIDEVDVATSVGHVWVVAAQVDRKPQGVIHGDVDASVVRSSAKPLGAVAARGTRQDAEFHPFIVPGGTPHRLPGLDSAYGNSNF